ncbi:HAMP domain-containing histidine kinase [Flavobacterium sp. MAH-1]|uniref:histidine kinase n=1 Tax=Flavobacterium agri TaxID=2743471 RepID=A0A7Y8Y295_9FLAO|nr:HAMP domain-containing sensor histidine kinase [Flavobacterium agri]NUY81127.1 HAMP domain-containing histidine kinase [Flavobacterium agri]NYA71151.1 HAMP domain-containing histidine kinase [Flavobacterium agri]
MKIGKLNAIIILGLVAIIGILIAQLLWTKQAYSLEEKKFSQKVHIALLEVARKLYEGTNHDLPSENPVVKVSNDYYIVNVNNDFEPDVLEFYLKGEFEKSDIHTDFEYAMYNCQSDEMVYGDYVSSSVKSKEKKTVYFPKHKNLVYYFAIRFPNETTYLFSSLKFWFFLSGALIIILLVYVYSIVTILQQKKYSELQRDFINNMTHEFKTPLSSILLASNYLSKQPQISEDEKLHKYTNIIISQSNKLNSHIGEILSIAKSDSVPLTMDKKRISVLTVLNEVVENMQLKHETLTISIKAEKDVFILADAFHFTNIVYNLIDNSIKYCDGKPSITVKISEENGMLKMDFADNGIGIPQNKLSDIFDKFYRIPNKLSNEVTGFGLGLYYVKKICTLHGWKISARNNPDKGITVTLTIPIR